MSGGTLLLRRFAALAFAVFGPGAVAADLKPWTGGKAPGLVLKDLKGATIDLADYRGKVVLLNFWATWCEPCRDEMPSLELLAQRHENDGVTVLAINYQEPVPAIRRFLEAQPVTLPLRHATWQVLRNPSLKISVNRFGS